MQPVTIHASDIKQLIEPHLYDEFKDQSYEIRSIHPVKLLTSNRLDIVFKLTYLEFMKDGPELAEKLYSEHIHALTLGKYTEPGSPTKNSLTRYILDFEKTRQEIAEHGFDATKSLIPLGIDGSILNGAHRVASAIYERKPVTCVQIDSVPHHYNYEFFYTRNVARPHIELVVSKFIETVDNVYMALIWPSAIGRDQQIMELIPRIVYKKEVELNPIGARNLLIQVYHSEQWLGTYNDRFRGVDGKLVECFRNFNPLRVIAFQAESLHKVLEVKQQIRELFNLDKHSIHITDTKDEAIRVSRLLFNDNSIHFLNHGDPYKYSANDIALRKLKFLFHENHIDPSRFLIDGSLLLSLYGIRENQDIDYLSLDDLSSVVCDGLNDHEESLKYHSQEKSTLVLDPAFHFYYEGLKFISFSQLYNMKNKRGEEKDRNDLDLMDAMIAQDNLTQLIANARQNLYYVRVKVKTKLIELLRATGLYVIVRGIYRTMKGKY